LSSQGIWYDIGNVITVSQDEIHVAAIGTPLNSVDTLYVGHT